MKSISLLLLSLATCTLANAQILKNTRPTATPTSIGGRDVRVEVIESRRQKPKNEDNLKVEQYILPNGLTVYLNEDHSLPSVYGGVAVNAGGKYDPKDATGMGHYLEHMLFKGTNVIGTRDYQKEKPFLDRTIALYDSLGATTDEAQRKMIQAKINEVGLQAAEYAVPNDLDRMLKSFGSTGVNAFTAFELIFYHNTFPASESEKWITLYADRFQNPVFRLFQSELEVVYEEKNKGSDNMAGSLFDVVLTQFFPKHPYGQGIIGKTEHLKNPSLRKMYEYYNTYYVPNNMALVLSGDFDSEKIKPMILEKFGQWKKKEVPAFVAPKEAPFKGREVITKHLTPVGVGIMGFRSVPNGHADQYGLEVARQLLSNSGQTGLFDKLTNDRKIMVAQMIPLQLNDEGMIVFFFVPKILKQSIANAEKLILAEMAKLRKGDFSDAQLSAAKQQLKLQFYRNLEGNQERGTTIANLFTQKTTWEEYMAYPQKIDALTKEEIMRISNQYLGDNYMLIQSKTGFPKKDKLAKPGFKPVAPKESVESAYSKTFANLPSGTVTNPFVKWDTDVFFKQEIGAGLYVTPNPINDIFSFTIRYKTGSFTNPRYEKVAYYMDLVGSKDLAFTQFKQKMDSLGCTVNFVSSEKNTDIQIEGIETNAVEAIKLVGKLMQNPEVNPEKIKNLSEGVAFEPRLFKREKEEVGAALKDYAMYGKNAPLCKRMTASEVKAIKAETLVEDWKKISSEEPEYHYIGKKNPNLVEDLITRFLPQANTPTKEVLKPLQTYTENTILFLNDSKSRQSHINFYILGNDYKIEDEGSQDAFNSYFGGDMSSLMFQEIREFRSLAYTARGYYMKPEKATEKGYFWGYIGCQGDKTLDAITTLSDMLTNLPQKADRITAIRSGLIAKVPSNKPNFRAVSERIQVWKDFGYTADPNEARAVQYPNLKFSDIDAFYAKNIKGKPIVITIVGDKSQFDMTKLAKFGKIQEVQMKDIFRE